jgi:hypothetical protein
MRWKLELAAPGRSPKLAAFVAQNGPLDHFVRRADRSSPASFSNQRNGEILDMIFLIFFRRQISGIGIRVSIAWPNGTG